MQGAVTASLMLILGGGKWPSYCAPDTRIVFPNKDGKRAILSGHIYVELGLPARDTRLN